VKPATLGQCFSLQRAWIYGPLSVLVANGQASRDAVDGAFIALVQHVNLIAKLNPRGFQLAERGSDPAISQVVARVVVKPDDQNPGMVASGSDDQIMQVLEVFGIASQNREGVGNRVYKYPRIRSRQQPDISSQDRIVSRSEQP
jgi:hypothetical protein